MKFILGTKLGMTQVFRDDGRVVPVTRISAGPCVVTQVKSAGTDNVNAVQIGYGEQKSFRLNKAQQGHLKGLSTVRFLRDVPTKDEEHGLKRGDTFSVGIFSDGDKVHVTGHSKGKGFQGVVKRHNFAGSLKTHGHKDQHRMPGSIGATGPARVFKGTRMPGHMGDEQVTVKNLEVVQVDSDNNELFIKGAVPGAKGGLLCIACPDGSIDVTLEHTDALKTETETDVPAEQPVPVENDVKESAEEPSKDEAQGEQRDE
jgi:large subunit ribosomal protein L3